MLLPTDHRVVEALEVFVNHAPQGASEDPQSPPSPQAVLAEYFDASNTTPTLLLYHLEVCTLTVNRTIGLLYRVNTHGHLKLQV